MEIESISHTLKIKTPNEEQRLAIEHSGGKILSAGAGSGKTFVLIEHLIYLLEKLKSECTRSDWEVKIPQKMQRIVLMTFTVKASGEMSSRMSLKVDEKILMSESQKTQDDLIFWTLVKKNLVYLNMTTISSFCRTLLKDELKPLEIASVDVVSDIEFKAKVTTLFSQWFDMNQAILPHVIQSSADDLIDSIINIFSNPEMRLTWNQQANLASIEEELNIFIFESFLKDTKWVDKSIDFNVDKKEQSKAWYNFLQSFDSLRQQHGELSALNYKKYAEWSMLVGKSPAERYVPENFKKAVSYAIELRNWVKVYFEHLLAYEQENKTFVFWSNTFRSLFEFVEKNYLTIPGLIFADLEYYTYKNLQIEENVKKVDQNYDYFIVDEFQDTSRIQYEIIKKLINKKPNKLFCVGDKKQAIYGFRGGELQVFNECVNDLGSHNEIVLKNNFRSFKEIVQFNNAFFTYLFPLGSEYTGIDPHAVAMEEQNAGKLANEEGKIHSLVTQVTNNYDEKPEPIDALEAKVIFDEINNSLADQSIHTVCILYRKLGPSEHLLNLFDHSFDYEVQIKVQMNEDPIISLFLLALELKISFDDELKKDRIYFLMVSVAKAVGVKSVNNKNFEDYFKNTMIMPQVIAFENLLAGLGISNSIFKENLSLLYSISKICSGDTKKIYALVYSEMDQSFSYFIKTGISKKKVIIMTAHASKGLEFDCVIIGGAHTNGSYRGLDKIIGKWPNSFKWKSHFSQKGFYKSPAYLLESLVGTSKDFSEAKRLLYVVCTRAIKKLCWVDLRSMVKDKNIELVFAPNSWINVLRNAEFLNCYELTQKVDIDLNTIEHQKATPALVMRDFVGLNPKDHKLSMGLMVETSVTRLSSLAVCPFKFYLSEVCKLEGSSAGFISSSGVDASEENEDSEDEEIFFSSKARGSKIHLDLFNFFSNIKNENEVLENKDDSLSWAKSEVQKLLIAESQMFLEKQIKFQLFGQMVSGTPDACIINPDELIVLDYKTGSLDRDHLDAYWFQVHCYAYAMIKTKRIAPEKKIIVILMFVDEETSLTKTLSYDEVQDFLYDQWRKTECLTQVNHKHCLKCEYSSICQFAQV